MQFLPGSCFGDIYAWTSHHVVRNPGHKERLCVGVALDSDRGDPNQEMSEQGNTEITPAQPLFKGNRGTAETNTTL